MGPPFDKDWRTPFEPNDYPYQVGTGARHVDVKGYYVDVKGYYVDVKGYYVDVKGYYVDVKPLLSRSSTGEFDS
eukprot:5170740-Pyramimonas_sp.AAC.1